MKKGWQKMKLGGLCTLISGRHIEPKDYNTKCRGVGYLTGPADFGQLNPIISKWTEHPQALAQSGDILITVKGAGVGKINLLDADNVAISRQLMAIRVAGADPRLVYAFLGSQFEYFQSLGSGATVPGLCREDILGLQVSMPPLPEQRRIVGLLDAAFAGIATATAHAEKNLQNAHALFESHLQAVFSQRGKGWEEKTLDEICIKITDGEHLRPKVTTDGVPFLSAKDVLDHDVVFTAPLFVSETDATKFRKRCDPSMGDILIVSRGATVGRTCIVKTSRTFCLLGSVILLRAGPTISSHYLSYALKSPAIRGKLTTASEASAQQAIYLRDIKPLKIACPSLAAQKAIASALDALLVETQCLGRLYEQKLAALAALKRSLLHQAFAGEL
jgi:type I restriction enzyme S subunit